MKKSIFKKAIVALMVIAMLLPCFPVIAAAETPTVTTRTVTEADKAWYGDGNATEFTISTAGELAYFMELGTKANNYSGKTFKLANDIVWNDGVATADGFVPSAKQGNVIYKWTPFAQTNASNKEFYGVFDGQGHTIHGLYIDASAKNVGFIGQTRNGTVKNISFENAYVKATGSSTTGIGIAVGTYFGNVTVENVHTNGHVNASGAAFTALVGGLVGGSGWKTATLKITNCTSSGSVIGTRVIGGLVGGTLSTTATEGKITMTDCVNYAEVTGIAIVGGLLGSLVGPGTFTRCYSLGKIVATNDGMWSSYFTTLKLSATPPTADSACRETIFQDCYYAENAGSSVQIPLFLYKGAVGNKLTVTYGETTKTEYYYPEHDNCNTIDAESGEPRRREAPELANHAKKLFTNAALAVPAKGTDAVKVEGVQVKMNDTTYAARFLTTVHTAGMADPSAVKSIGFQVSILGDYAKNGSSVAKKQDCGAVYTSILSDYGMTTVTAQELEADYVGTLVIDKIPATGVQHILVRAYCTTEGDAVSYSEAAVFTFVNGAFAGSTYLSTAASDSTQA